jgi:hypothetical protein
MSTILSWAAILYLMMGSSAEPCRVTVNIEPARAELPIEGLHVRVREVDESTWQRFRLTNEDRHVATKVSCGEVIVEVGQAMGTLYGEWFSTIDRRRLNVQREDVIDISLPLLQRLTLAVQDKDGAPQGPVEVRVKSVPGSGANRERANVRIGTSGTSDLFVKPGDYHVEMFSFIDRELLSVLVDDGPVDPSSLIQVRDSPKEVTFVLKPVPLVRSQVVDTSGNPMGGIGVTVTLANGASCPKCWLTDQSGKLVVFTAEFPIVLKPSDPQGALEFVPSEVVVTASEPSRVVEFTGMRRTGPRLTGQARRRESLAPLPGGLVTVEYSCDSGSPMSFEQELDTAGRFDLPCPENCSVKLTVSAQPGSEFQSKVWHGTTENCSGGVFVDLERGIELVGRIIEASQPLSGVQVLLDMGVGGRSRTDSSGTFVFQGVAPGNHSVEISKTEDDWLITTVNGEKVSDGRATVTLSATDPAQPYVMEVERGGTLCLIASQSNEAPGAVKRVELYDTESLEKIGERYIEGVSPGGEVCSSRPVVPGSYLIRLAQELDSEGGLWWPGTESPAEATPIRVAGGKVVRLSLGSTLSVGESAPRVDR